MNEARAVVRAEVDHGSAELVGDPDRPQGWTLLVDGTAQSHVDLDDPTHLEFEYVRRLAHVVDLVAPPTAPLRVLHLGGGAWTLPRYVAATRPGSTQQVAEIDAGLVDLVAARLPVDGYGIEVTVGDARAVLTEVPTGSVDLLVLDVFAGARTPAHLTTTEFVADAARVLAPGGMYAANVADGGALPFARTQFAVAGSRFARLAVVVAPNVLQGRRFGNLVLLARDGELPVQGLVRRAAGDPFPARVLDDAQVRELATTPVGDRGATPSPMPPSGFFGRP
ncbi:spermidine synthase [Pseudonocardia abyssalis]|uniref:Fused MFS/spermidine synthase n=1 Tax=Pseudonocardia abyssalis TaxID=2792008 RepID=A0ABS6UQ37_9PSEU|nr:fused MFS/spermidine synthase [Pseudonocardia abyssalis]MBW0118239.1 fused MFS/spermidine synthase [Pseudonocardia abyssalis]MBW0134365.1 fused MFS/spermidine synthase [Pseudonocardia abyssalis]